MYKKITYSTNLTWPAFSEMSLIIWTNTGRVDRAWYNIVSWDVIIGYEYDLPFMVYYEHSWLTREDYEA